MAKKRRKLTTNSLYEALRSQEWQGPTKYFSQQQGGQKTRSVQIISKAIQFISGGESYESVVDSLLKTEIFQPSIKKMKRHHEQIHESVMEKLAEEYNSTANFKKRKILSYVADIHSHSELQNYGFRVHHNTFKKI